MFESVDAETIGIEGQPYMMRISIACGQLMVVWVVLVKFHYQIYRLDFAWPLLLSLYF